MSSGTSWYFAGTLLGDRESATAVNASTGKRPYRGLSEFDAGRSRTYDIGVKELTGQRFGRAQRPLQLQRKFAMVSL